MKKVSIVILSLVIIFICVQILLLYANQSKEENVFLRNVLEIEKLNPDMTDPVHVVNSVEKRLNVLGYENVKVGITNDNYGNYNVEAYATKTRNLLFIDFIKLPDKEFNYPN